MQNNGQRSSGRRNDELRPLRVSYDLFGYAASSVLLELGNTKVLCSVHLQNSVPPFLKGKKTGWLNAEYAMLPSATNSRTTRELSSCKRSGRSVEISRLIGRALRPMIDFDVLGEQTIHVDCDVLQADGGTRTTAITGAALAITRAAAMWLETGAIRAPILIEHVVAVSIGVREQQLLLDLDFEEDSSIDADFNIVLTRNGSIIEMQGTAEKKAVSWDLFEQMRSYALKGHQQLLKLFDAADAQTQSLAATIKVSQRGAATAAQPVAQERTVSDLKPVSPLFSIRNRVKSS